MVPKTYRSARTETNEYLVHNPGEIPSMYQAVEF